MIVDRRGKGRDCRDGLWLPEASKIPIARRWFTTWNDAVRLLAKDEW